MPRHIGKRRYRNRWSFFDIRMGSVTKIKNQMFCDTHQCRISITGCMLRQQRNQENPPAWMYNKIPGDPKCKDCAQGKAVMKKYKHKKEALMEATTENRSLKLKTELDELEMAARKRADAKTDEEAAPPATNLCGTVVEGKTCNRCDLVVGLDVAENHFHTSKYTKDGFETTCKECRKRMDRERREARKAAGKSGKPGCPKTSKPKKNPEKAAAAPPDPPVAEVVTAAASPGADTIPKNNHPVDLDGMVRELFAAAGRPHLYEALEKAAFDDIRPPHLQAVYLVECCLDTFDKGK